MSAKQKSKNSFLIQGTILAAAGILVKVIGLFYRVPLNNILKGEGIGYYSNAFDIYSLLLLLSSLSLPLAVSKIVSAKMAVNKYKDVKRILVCSLLFALFIGSFIGGLTFVFADNLARIWGYPSCAPALRVLAPTLFIMTFVGVLRGYFQGLGNMVPTAVSQIFEQIVNAIVSIVAANSLFKAGLSVTNKYGPKGNMSASYGAAGGTLGTCMGAFTAFIFLLINYLIYKKNQSDYKKTVDLSKESDYELESYGTILKAIILTIVPVLLSTTIYNFSNIIDSAIYGNVLKSKGIPEDIKSITWGVYSGKYRLISNVPIAVASALSSSVVPTLVLSTTRGDKEDVKRKIGAIIKFTLLIAFPSGVGLTVLGKPIMAMLFGYEDIDLSTKLMMFSLLTVVSYSLSTITNSVLQGIDKLRLPVIHAAISLGIHVVLLVGMLKFTKLDIISVLICDVLFAGVVCLLNAISLRKYSDYRADILGTYLKPLAASLIMGLFTFAIYKGLKILISFKIATIISCVFAVVIYAILLVLLNVITKEELDNMPKGASIYRLLKKVNLMK